MLITKHAKRVWEDFDIKNLGEYHDLYAQSDTLLLADVFGNFQNEYIKIFKLKYAHFFQHENWHCRHA